MKKITDYCPTRRNNLSLFKRCKKWSIIFCLVPFVSFANQDPVVVSEPSYTIAEDSSQKVYKRDFVIQDNDSTSTGLYLDPGTNYTLSSYTVIPNKDFFGVLYVNYRVRDNDGGETSGTFNITVTSVNDDPVVTSEPNFTIKEDSSKTIYKSHFGITDVDSSSTGLYLDAGTNYTLSGYTVIPRKDFFGTLSVNYRVRDNHGGETSGNFNLNVSSVNDKPVVTSEPNFTIKEDSSKTIYKSNFGITDVDSSSTGLYLDAGTNYTLSGYTVIPKKDFFGTLSVNYRVRDNHGGETPGSFNITVTSVNDNPVVTSEPSFTIAEDTFQKVYKRDFVIQDIDSYSTGLYLDAGSNYTLSDYEVHPNEDFFGTLSVNYRIRDIHGGETPGSFDITVTSVNDNPVVISEPSFVIEQGGSQKVYKADFQIIDVDSTSTGLYLDAGANYTLSEYTVIPDQGFYGDLNVNYRIVDSNGGETPGSFNITVNELNVNVLLTYPGSSEGTQASTFESFIVSAEAESGQAAQVAKIEFSLDGVEWFEGSATDGVYTHDFGLLEAGEYTLHMRVTTVSGSEEITTAQVTVLASTIQRRVIFIHTDLLGSPAAETDKDGVELK